MTEPKSARSSPYVHGSGAAEQARLGTMNEILNARQLAAIGPIDGERVLEVGAGTGLFALELSRAAGPTGCVVAVERDLRQLSVASELCREPDSTECDKTCRDSSRTDNDPEHECQSHADIDAHGRCDAPECARRCMDLRRLVDVKRRVCHGNLPSRKA